MGKLPYQVYLQTWFSTGPNSCGGTLLNKRYVLTAMHCIKEKEEYSKNTKVVLGEHNIQKDWETKAKVQVIQVSKIISREDYNTPEELDNDIALLKLAEDVKFSSSVVPACLPANADKDYTGQYATVSGWGAIRNKGPGSEVLKETKVKVMKKTDKPCLSYKVDDKLICGWAPKTDSCQGDSGGPLAVKDDGKNTVIGVVSWGYGCAGEDAGIYAKVTGYLDWIHSHIADGWCGGAAGPATPAKPATTKGKACDVSCIIGKVTGREFVGDVESVCSAGVCTAVDGSDLCKTLEVEGIC